MNPLSVVIITFNEEKNIERCLESVKDIADEIVVVDSGSVDKTEALCTAHGVRFFFRKFEGHIEQKNFALGLATNPLVLALDADEAVSLALKQEILAIKNECAFDGFFIRRLTNYCGSWIRHTDWYPDWKIRLWDKRKGVWGGVNPHDHVAMRSPCRIKYIKADILHYSYPSIHHHIAQLNYFTDIMAGESFKKGEKSSCAKIFINPFWKFCKSYVFRLGFLDGYHGFIIGAISAFATFIKYVKLREMTRTAGRALDTVCAANSEECHGAKDR